MTTCKYTLPTFHRFPDLPFELRSKIWRFAITPRAVRFPDSYTFPSSNTWEHYLRGIPDHLHTNEYPPLLRVNKESRSELLFYEYRTIPLPNPDIPSLPDSLTQIPKTGTGTGNGAGTLWCSEDILYLDILSANDIYTNKTYPLNTINHIAIYDDASLLLTQSPLLRFLTLASLFTKAPHASITLILLDTPLSDPPDWYSPSNTQHSSALKETLRVQCEDYYATHISSMWLSTKRYGIIKEEETRWKRDVKVVFMTDLRSVAIVKGQNRRAGVTADEARRAGIAEAFRDAVFENEERGVVEGTDLESEGR